MDKMLDFLLTLDISEFDPVIFKDKLTVLERFSLSYDTRIINISSTVDQISIILSKLPQIDRNHHVEIIINREGYISLIDPRVFFKKLLFCDIYKDYIPYSINYCLKDKRFHNLQEFFLVLSEEYKYLCVQFDHFRKLIHDDELTGIRDFSYIDQKLTSQIVTTHIDSLFRCYMLFLPKSYEELLIYFDIHLKLSHYELDISELYNTDYIEKLRRSIKKELQSYKEKIEHQHKIRLANRIYNSLLTMVSSDDLNSIINLKIMLCSEYNIEEKNINVNYYDPKIEKFNI